MLQLPLAELDIAPGRLVSWTARSTTTSDDRHRRPARCASFNRDKHHRVAQEYRDSKDPIASWLATTFEIRGNLNRQALESALVLFVRRHEVLRCEFRRLTGDLTCQPIEPDDITLCANEHGDMHSTAEIRAQLAQRFEQIDILCWPLFIMGRGHPREQYDGVSRFRPSGVRRHVDT